MTQLKWSETMKTGLPALDDAHRAFVEQLLRTAEAGDDAFPERLNVLIALVEQDFCAEERLMEEIAFPVLNSHREQHARVLGGLHHAQARVMAGDIGCGRDALALLMQWFPMHLATMDVALAAALDIAAAAGTAAGRPAA